MDNVTKLKEIIDTNNGIILTADLVKNNIHRQYLRQLETMGYIKKVSRGVYAKSDKEINEFFIVGQKYKKGIFSHNTALYFYDLTDRTPINLDLTFPSNITVHDSSIKVHYIKEENHLTGANEMKLDDGTRIKVYNIERTICDIIRDRNKIDLQIFNDAIKGYMKRKDKNLALLYKYAQIFNIENILSKYMEVL